MDKDLIWSFFETTGNLELYLSYKKDEDNTKSCTYNQSKLNNEVNNDMPQSNL